MAPAAAVLPTHRSAAAVAAAARGFKHRAKRPSPRSAGTTARARPSAFVGTPWPSPTVRARRTRFLARAADAAASSGAPSEPSGKPYTETCHPAHSTRECCNSEPEPL